MKIGYAFAVSIALFGTTAYAEDTISAFDWTGGSIGAVAGVNVLNGDTTIRAYDPSDYHADSTSGAFGAKAAYNHQFTNNVVLGAEASLLAVFNDGDASTGGGVNEVWGVGADWQGSVVARVGYAMDRLLPYIKGGVAFLRLDDLQYRSAMGDTSPLSRTHTGWTVGFGADYAMTDRWIVGADYSYADFESHDFENDEIGSTIVEPSTHTISVSISYKF